MVKQVHHGSNLGIYITFTIAPRVPVEPRWFVGDPTLLAHDNICRVDFAHFLLPFSLIIIRRLRCSAVFYCMHSNDTDLLLFLLLLPLILLLLLFLLLLLVSSKVLGVQKCITTLFPNKSNSISAEPLIGIKWGH